MNKMEKIIIYSQEENNEKKKEISNEIREEKIILKRKFHLAEAFIR
jgi:hypothetical protein